MQIQKHDKLVVFCIPRGVGFQYFMGLSHQFKYTQILSCNSTNLLSEKKNWVVGKSSQ